MKHEDYQELLTANALSALDAADARVLAMHLESCADCRSQAEEWEKTAAMLAFDADSLEPSPQVRENIIAAIRSDSSQNAANQRATADSERAHVIPFARPARTGRSSFSSYAAIAAMIAVVGLAISLLLLWQQKRANDAQVARLSTDVSEMQAELQRQREVVSLITSPGAHMAELAGTNIAPGAHAMIAYDKDGQAMLMARGLPAVPSGKAYQLWFIKDGKKMPGKVFKIDPSGTGMLKDHVPAEALNAAVFAITLEPENGVQVPTGAVFLASGS
jgi:anti-sigma-K factor RskA